ncbi:MarR family transcriptional regulator [Corynebacterium sp. sy017]|uniref:transcriptional regulator n=1 Tax=unclassified Corynebacterium TaxID=2624378 RepID=UPI001186826B|nr:MULTISPECIES: transcriptional regulator [unclassified Corynebacterium]MBP3089391.1 MarR family transcriptional regulator [Corynebacterium sp. sy017]QDZ43319.1 MarR family transcriptional regulator [Corynebacterium sp. sy039]TSD90919.1 MarR family transcriptional regulator [Corynebacterium sp. SY003]
MNDFAQLDPIIHPLNRFKICSILNTYGATEDTETHMQFSVLRLKTGLSDATLSKQLSILEEKNYISRFREYGSSRKKDIVWITLTQQGKKAFDAHLAALKELSGL